MHLCTDNAAMIAAAAYYRYRRGDLLGLDADAVPGLRLDTVPGGSAYRNLSGSHSTHSRKVAGKSC